MLGRRNVRDSVGYVTLGLFSHALLDELLEAKRKPETPPARKQMVIIAIESLKAIESPGAVEPSRWKDLVFQDYQEARTLRKALNVQTGMENVDQIRETLDEIIGPNTPKKKRMQNTDKAIKFFGELARIAIINAECPEESVPRGVRELVH
jgi:hypothetical protein